jgi:hypothetical protein
MGKEFVPYELALRLKRLGFDEECFGYYDVDSGYSSGYAFCYSDVGSQPEIGCSAPLYQQVFSWLREKNFHVNIDSYHCLGKNKPFGLSIDYLHKSGKWDYVDYRDDEDFETYEEAQTRAIEIIIEILERNKTEELGERDE